LKNNQTKAHLALLAANLFFGMNYSAVQFITKKLVPPFGLNLARAVITTALLWMLVPFTRKTQHLHKKDFLRLFLCSMTGIVINQLLFIKGLSMTFSIHAALLVLITPILITLLASVVGKEKMNYIFWSGLLLGIAGALILILNGKNNGQAGNVFWGDLFVIINSFSYAMYFVLVKPLMKDYHPVQILRWIFTIGTLFIGIFGWKELSAVSWQAFTGFDFLVFFFILIGATFFAYLFIIYGISILGASITGTYIYTQPVFASVIAVIFLGEEMQWYKGIAAILITTGVFLVSRKTTKNL
jgi:drug/metabolite transporter (DMT)-like permease